jgi:hypothetical protein
MRKLLLLTVLCVAFGTGQTLASGAPVVCHSSVQRKLAGHSKSCVGTHLHNKVGGIQVADRSCRQYCSVVFNHCLDVGRDHDTCWDEYQSCLNGC